MPILIINTDPGFTEELRAACEEGGLRPEALAEESEALMQIALLKPDVVILGQPKVLHGRLSLAEKIKKRFPGLPLISIAEQGELGEEGEEGLAADLHRPFLFSELLRLLSARLPGFTSPPLKDRLLGQERPQSLLGPQTPSSSIERMLPEAHEHWNALVGSDDEVLDGSTLSINEALTAERTQSGSLPHLDEPPRASKPFTAEPALSARRASTMPPAPKRPPRDFDPPPSLTVEQRSSASLSIERTPAVDLSPIMLVERALAKAQLENDRLTARNQEMRARLERARAEAEKTYSEISALQTRAKADLEKTRTHYQALLADRDATIARMGSEHEAALAALRSEQEAILAAVERRQKVHSQSVEFEHKEAEAARQESVLHLRELHEADRVAQERRHEAAEDALREEHRQDLARLEREKRTLESRVEALISAQREASIPPQETLNAALSEAERRHAEALSGLDAEWRQRYETQEARYESRIEALFDVPEELAHLHPNVARLRQEHDRIKAQHERQLQELESLRAERDRLRGDLNHLRVHVLEGRESLSKLKIALNAAHVIVTSKQ